MPSKTTQDVRRGDVFAISTAIGYAFFQCVGTKYGQNIHVVRALQTALPSVSDFQTEMVYEKERYYFMMTVSEGVRLKLITYVGAYPLPRHARVPLRYRRLDYIPYKNIRNWYELCLIGRVTIYERRITKLTDKFLALSGNSVWNVAYLRERIEENWSLKDWK